MRLSLYRRQRSHWWRHEYHDRDGVRWFHIMFGHPRYHAWWAFSLYVYF